MNLFTAIMICSVFHTNSITNAMVMTGSNNNPLAITAVVNGIRSKTRTDFKSEADALSYAQGQIASGNTVDIGVLQIPSLWLDKLTKRGISLNDLLKPCKNLAVGTDLLNEAEAYCASRTDSAGERDDCALSFYRTSSPTAGLAYATMIQAYAKAHPVKSNPINHQIDFEGWQSDPNRQLPTPTFGQSAAEPTSDSTDSSNEQNTVDNTDNSADTTT